jgi:DNA polymerase III alpha subunit
VATVSVIRPGAANEDKKTKFARRYLGLEEPEFVHPDLEEVLQDSYGLLIYEEHILLVSNRFAGMDFGTADLLRRILIKKTDDDAMDELEAVFRSCARRKGRPEKEIDTVWHELKDFSGYMFNKAHGAAYAIEAYHGCWLKYHWPLHFLAAVLNNQRGFYRPLVYVMEILRHGGRFVLPDVRRKATAFEVEQGHIHIPLWQIKGLSRRFRDNWSRALERDGFHSWKDFVSRTQLDPADAELLARAGALRGFYDNRHEAIWRAGQVRRTRGRETAAADLFEVAEQVDTTSFATMDPVVMGEQEAELLGFPVTLSPLELWMPQEEQLNTVAIDELPRYVGQEMRIAGIQVSHRLHRTIKGEMMKFVTIADESGMAETVLFPQAYKTYGWELSQKRSACLRVYIEWDETESGLSLSVTEAE